METSNGKVVNTISDDSDEDGDEEEEEVESISASLVLEVINRKPDGTTDVKVNGKVTPTLSRKNSVRSRKTSQNQRFGAYDVQRSISNTSIPEYHPISFDHVYHSLERVRKDRLNAEVNGTQFSSTPNILIDIPKPEGMQSGKFWETLSQQTKIWVDGVRDLKSDLVKDEKCSSLKVNPDSDWDQNMDDCLKNSHALYQETKSFKDTMNHLRKIEAKTKQKKQPRSPWIRRTLLLVGLCGAVSAFVYAEVKVPEDLQAKSIEWLNQMDTAKTLALEYLLKAAEGQYGRANIITVSN